MNYTEAIDLALAGREEGFRFLYDETYKSKYYLALQYMKNEQAAEDVLQEAYMKAFSKLDTLGQPDAFPAWLGTIVGNTAKNMLQKKNPMLFTDVAVDNENETFEYEIEDDNVENQPEMSYTRQETQILVRELIDSLSPEQRMCILMFEIEGISIKEIAATLNCSENTVKSRLNYGRKNIKIKAEELQKKGYKLYSVAPLPLLLYLLRTEEGYLAAEGFFAHSAEQMAQRVIPSSNGAAGSTNGSHTTGQKAGSAAKTAAKTKFIHTAAFKIAAAAVAGLCVVSGAIYYSHTKSEEQPKPQEKKVVQEEVQKPKELKSEDYPKLVEGNLTKEELELVLAYGPTEIPEQGFTDRDYQMIFNSLCQIPEESGTPIENYGTDAQYRSRYSVNDVNRLFASFTDYQFSEENDSDTEYGINVDGDAIVYVPATINYDAKATIVSTEYTDEEINLHFTYDYHSYDSAPPYGEQYTKNKKAVLKPDENGLFRIVEIVEADPPETADKSAAAKDTKDDKTAIKNIYSEVLDSVRNQEPGYEFTDVIQPTGEFSYFLYDMDGDGIQELIVGKTGVVDQAFLAPTCRVFSCEKSEKGYTLKTIAGQMLGWECRLAQDENGLFVTGYLSRGMGETGIYRVTLENGTVVTAGSTSYEFIMGSSEDTEYQNSNPEAMWTDISDLSGLDSLK